jgi:O-acetyl-ADP-ribose deacetylase (regulator of RNase III)
MFTFDRGTLVNPRYIINFPTKRHWKGYSRIEDIAAGLDDLVDVVQTLGIRSVAVPPLGCGNGGLDWREVSPLIERAFKKLPNVRAVVFPPSEAPAPSGMVIRTPRPRLTRGRALLIKLLGCYGLSGYKHSKLEVQKLAYLLQARGESLNLKFVKHLYGPYADTLNHVLQHLEGHYTSGYGDRSRQSEIHLLPGSEEEADTVLQDDLEARRRLSEVSQLIEGFASPYGMELLATVHWVASVEGATADADILAQVKRWSPRKATRFEDRHVRKAIERLRSHRWI